MGRRGPPRKPTALKLLQGNPGDHKLCGGEVKPGAAAAGAAAPSWLSAGARKIWRERFNTLHAIGLLTVADLDSFAMFCDCFDQVLELKKFLKKNGSFYCIYADQTPEEVQSKTPLRLKYTAQFPQVAEYHKFRKELKAWALQFGLTPAARSGLEVDFKSGPDEFERFLYGES